MSVTPYLMIQPLADSHAQQLKASAASRRRRRSQEGTDMCSLRATPRPRAFARLRSAMAG